MSAILSKLNLSNLTILSPDAALAILATRGEWSEVARQVAAILTTHDAGSVVRFDSVGLSPDDFKRTTATETAKVGDIDYSGITAACRTYGILVKRLTDDSRGFYMPHNREDILARVKASKAKAAAKAKAKAAAAKASKSK